ncbi:MAG: hypothetical protein JSU08_14480 [Acidobacteria bacterium]|nr:hypothetical protein [Acidobacteriota bacterium]
MSVKKDDGSFAERVSSSYRQLSLAASHLNLVSDELGKSIVVLDAALKKLNLGISTWSRLDRVEDALGNYTSRYLGYAKVNNRWGIALRTVAGNNNQPEEATVEEWLFNDAPRALRIEAVEKLPDLFENLIREADNTIRKVKAQTLNARHLAQALSENSGSDSRK